MKRKEHTFREDLDEQLKNPEFKMEWDSIQPEREIMVALMTARIEQNLTQKDIAKLAHINQADVSKLENGTKNPSLSMMKRIAKALGKRIEIKFVPDNTVQD